VSTEPGGASAVGLVARATAAPSSHNTQPWLFEIDGDAITLIADRTRALPVNDPDDRELTISCGAALMNLRVAARASGLDADVEALPDGDDAERLAVVRLRAGSPASAADRELDAAIDVRRTYRGILLDRPVPEPLGHAIVAAVDAEGARMLTIAGDDERQELIELIVEGDHRHFDDRSWRRELAAWMHPRRDRDGLAFASAALPVARLAVTAFDLGGSSGTRDSVNAAEAPLLAVLATSGDGPRDWLTAGQAMQRALLVAAAAGMQASFLNQPVQVDDLRPRLARLAGCAHPQLVLRFGYPPPYDLPAMRRRPVEDVIGRAAPPTRG
jgi:hypothetical protein